MTDGPSARRTGSLTPGATRDNLFGAGHLHEIYTRARRDYTGRVTVPVLWDRETETIVSNESSEIIRMFNSAFNALGASGDDLYPPAERAEIDELNAVIYDTFNNGVYKCGFAKSQEAYEAAFDPLFADPGPARAAPGAPALPHRRTAD